MAPENPIINDCRKISTAALPFLLPMPCIVQIAAMGTG
jgi:hypothetical protein